MDLQWESSEASPCEAQPPGRINKAAFKLFGRRKPGSAVSAIFSVRGKAEVGKAALARSKTHDGLAEQEEGAVLEGGGKDEHQARPPASRPTVTKSLSFFSLLRRNGRRAGTEPRPPKQRKGLRGLFGSMRWPRREKEARGDRGAQGTLQGGGADEESEQAGKDAVVLNLEPQVSMGAPGAGDAGSSGEITVTASEDQNSRSPEGRKDSPGLGHTSCASANPCSSQTLSLSAAPTMTVTPPDHHTNADHPPSEPSVDRLCCMFTDVTSLKSFDSLTGCGDIIADAEEEGAGSGSSGSSSGTGSSSGGGAGGDDGAPTVGIASPARLCLPPPASAPAPIPAPMQTILQEHTEPPKAQGSGVVAYMGGGEEMASPDEVDDADMQDLWHMLPQQGEGAARSTPAPTTPLGLRPEKKPPPVRALGLSKIPVSGRAAGRHPRQTTPDDGRGKELTTQDAPPNSDEGYWDSPTPGPEEDDDDEGGEEESASPLLRDTLPRDSCSGDALYDLYDAPERSPGLAASDEEVTSVCARASRLTMPPQAVPSSSSTSSFRSLKGSTSLPRDSRIPVSVKLVAPSHSASQGALAPAVPHVTQPKTEIPRTKIPVSKVPVRRVSNKPSSTRLHDPQRK